MVSKQAYVDFTKTKDLVADVKAASPDGLGPHAVLLVATAELPFQQAASYVRSRGTIVAIGLPAHAQLKAPVFDTVVRMIKIKGSYVGNRLDAKEAVDFFTRGLIKVPFRVVPLSDLPKIFALMREFFFFIFAFLHWFLYPLFSWKLTTYTLVGVCQSSGGDRRNDIDKTK